MKIAISPEPKVLTASFFTRIGLANHVLRQLREHHCHIVGKSVDGSGWEVKRNPWIAERIGMTRQIVEGEYLYWTRIEGVRVEYRMPLQGRKPTHLMCSICKRMYPVSKLPMVTTPDLYECFEAGCPVCGASSLTEALQ